MRHTVRNSTFQLARNQAYTEDPSRGGIDAGLRSLSTVRSRGDTRLQRKDLLKMCRSSESIRSQQLRGQLVWRKRCA